MTHFLTKSVVPETCPKFHVAFAFEDLRISSLWRSSNCPMKRRGLRLPRKGEVLTAVLVVAAWNICSHPRTRAPDTVMAS